MYFIRNAVLSLLMLGALAASDAGATPRAAPKAGNLPAATNRARETVPTMAPLAFVKFCITYQRQCQGTGSAERIRLTDEIWKQLISVNGAVNRRIQPDETKGGYDWSLNTTFGNCNDYAIQKQRELISRGLPISALSLSVVITRTGVGHLVLSVRTDRGDLVLDNLRSEVVPWSRTGYRWIKRQSAEDPRVWRSIAPARQASAAEPAQEEPS